MQIIQNIRDKGAAIVIAVIALSLIGFILMDSKQGSDRLFSASSTVIGKVNGENINYTDFNDKVKQEQDQYASQGQTAPSTYELQKNVWDRLVSETVLNTEFDKLGLVFSPKELASVIFSPEDAPADLRQAFTDKTTGQYDVSKAQQWWASAKKYGGEQKAELETEIIDPVKINALYTKYSSLINAMAYYPSWMQQKEIAENKAFATVSYVSIPYNVISDSSIKVTDDDITAYIQKHQATYKLDEEGRMLSYVSFDADPSPADTAKLLSDLNVLKPLFVADTNAKAFVGRNMSAITYKNIYQPKSKLTMQQKDTIVALPAGSVFGPYLDGKDFVLAKKIGEKVLPDSIKCRHILIATTDPQTGQTTLDDSTAKKEIDSIAAAIKNGASFDSLEAVYSSDKEAHKDKGVMTFDISTIQDKEHFAPEFGTFLLNEDGETKKTVHTKFGWHYIEILQKMNPEPAYKIAYMAKDILASQETVDNANSQAAKLSGEARDVKAFDAYVFKNGLQKTDVPTLVKENDYQLGGLQDARQLIKWAFTAKEGDVSDPYSIGDNFVVAVVDKVQPKGLPAPSIVRPQVERLIRDQKKADQISAKLGASPTLESAAAAYGKQIQIAGADSSLTFSSFIINGVGQEPKIIGAAFDKDYQTKPSAPISGVNGVYVIKVINVGSKPADAPDVVAQQAAARTISMRQQIAYGWFEPLKKLADISDNRSKFY